MSEHIHCLPAPRLAAEQWSRWAELRAGNPGLGSPFFGPRFTREVAAVRNDVEVAIVERDGEPVLFLPFQRSRRGTAHPVGGRLSDFHGPIASPETPVDLQRLLSSCRLRRWRFDHLVADASPFGAHVWRHDESPAIDLTDGFEAYVAERRRAGSQRLKRVRKKHRQLERNVGPVEFEFENRDPRVLQLLFDWKSAQYRRHGLPDLFARRWIVELLTRLLDDRNGEESCSMAVLRVAGRPVAIDLGFRGRGIFHSWFPSFDRNLSTYSPGNVLLLATAEAAPSLGITKIELGKGPETYKQSFCNSSVQVGTGVVDRSHVRRWVSRTLDSTRRRLAESWVGPALRPTLTAARRMVPTR